jgi:hypothetical protein
MRKEVLKLNRRKKAVLGKLEETRRELRQLEAVEAAEAAEAEDDSDMTSPKNVWGKPQPKS